MLDLSNNYIFVAITVTRMQAKHGLGLVLFVSTMLLIPVFAIGQLAAIRGRVISDGKAVPYATVHIPAVQRSALTDSSGNFLFEHIAPGRYKLHISSTGYLQAVKEVIAAEGSISTEITLEPMQGVLNDVVVSGTLREVKRLESPVPVEVYTPVYFKKNPTSCIFDALQTVNGVRPQLNCNVCNTGDIHINGLEGPYTMVLIDGMPIVSSLSTVYGLSGIPNSLVERIEIVKGPASSLYGSEAIGGLINIITKQPTRAPILSADIMATSWQEYNADLGFKLNAGSRATVLTGLNYFNYQQVHDKNNDRFTDVTLQHRFSVFQKWNFSRAQNRVFTIAARYFREERWGGETNWTKAFRGTDSIYGESISTRRVELIGNYQLPFTEKMMLSFSFNDHRQDSWYGITPFNADQQVGFAQLTWNKSLKQHELLAGAALRYTYYDDNTTATRYSDSLKTLNQPQHTWLPGLFVQDEIRLAPSQTVLLGLRYDYNATHGNIITPRIAYKLSLGATDIIRLNMGTGFRVVNLFTEDHAALTGARNVVITEDLQPEKSINVNLNYTKKLVLGHRTMLNMDITGWYTYFYNRIVADYEADPNKIIYSNLDGNATSKGISANIDLIFGNGLKVMAGATWQDVALHENGTTTHQLLTERISGTWAVSYIIKALHVGIDYTGNIYGPMQLPLAGQMDPRPATSPTWSIQNIQFVYTGFKGFEIYSGIKNLLNWTPAKNIPFLIARANDPFDKQVDYNPDGSVQPTPANPYALTFDPTYVYAPNQGARLYLGLRFTLK